MKTQAVVLHEPGQRCVIEEIDLDEPRANEVIVRVISSSTPVESAPSPRTTGYPATEVSNFNPLDPSKMKPMMTALALGRWPSVPGPRPNLTV